MALPTERTLRLSTKVSKSRVKNRLVSEGAILSVLYCSSKRWGWLCAHGWVGASTYRFVPRHSLVMIEWRVPFVFESRPFLFPKRKPPLAFAAHSFLEIPPPRKKNKNEERQGERAGRAVLRAWRDSASPRDRSVRKSLKPPRARRVRSQSRFLLK